MNLKAAEAPAAPATLRPAGTTSGTATSHATWKGRNTLQRRIVWLLQELGLDPLAVTASNLIFPRSRDEKSLQHEACADTCWAVHEQVLAIVQPTWVLTYGNTPYRCLGDRLGVVNEQRFPSGHGTWECRSFEVRLYAIDRHPEVVDWIKYRDEYSDVASSGCAFPWPRAALE